MRIAHGNSVEAAIVYTRSKATILFGGGGRCGPTNEPLPEGLGHILLNCLGLGPGEGVDTGSDSYSE